MLLGTIGLTLTDRQRLRHQQRLAAQALTGHGGFQPLVGDALVSRVHVHQHQSLGVFRQDIHTLELSQGIAQRRNIALVLRQARRRGV